MGEDPDWRGRSLASRSLLLLLIVSLSLLPTANAQHSICGSIDIRNDARTVFNNLGPRDDNIARYMNCTILEGTFSLSMITNSTTKEEDFVTFPNLVEITGYLLVFNVKSLTTLSRIFPNLRVIGGNQLIMNYALIIYQNPDMKDIGLPNLRVIRNGGVRIAENPSLCFAVQIDWKRITVGQIDDVLVTDGVASGQKCPDQCDDPQARCVRRTMADREGTVISCWNATTCQETCPFETAAAPAAAAAGDNSTTAAATTTPHKGAGPGCLVGTSGADSKQCHKACIAGCYELDNDSECVACAGFLHDGRCNDACPPGMYKYLSRCVTEEECLDSPEIRVDENWRMYKAVEGRCLYDCPPHYEVDYVNRTKADGTDKRQEVCRRCKGRCPKKCKGKSIDTISMAKDLTGCNIIEGSLDIQLRDRSKMTMLSDALKEIEVITGHLLIRFSPSLTSLSIFSKLREIRGETLFQKNYALVIYENQALNALFSNETLSNLKINASHGIQVQNNRNLCFQRVEALMKGLNRPVVAEDQSMYSNGDKAICDETVLTLTTSKVMSEGFILSWTAFNKTDTDHRKFLGYQIFYKRVESADLSKVQIDQDRSLCSDTWHMHFEPDTTKYATAAEIATAEGKKEQLREDTPRIVYEGKNAPTEEELGERLMNVTRNPRESKSAPAVPEPPQVMAVITHDGIAPNAFYAAYVTTKMVNHQGAKNARSNVIIVNTQYSNPTPPRITSITPQGTSSLKVEWDEPHRPNGVITHYVVTWHAQYRPTSYEVAHCCDGGGRSYKPENQRVDAADAARGGGTTTASSFLAAITGGQSDEETCAARGCCTCSAPGAAPAGVGMTNDMSSAFFDESEEDADPDRQHDFENAVQNIVFVPSETPMPSRNKRSIKGFEQADKREGEKEEEKGEIPEEELKHEYQGATVVIPVESDEEREEREKERRAHEMEQDKQTLEYDFGHKPGYLIAEYENRTKDAFQATLNVSSKAKNEHTITGLNHSTTYQISIVACQNLSVDPNFCSLKPAYKSQITDSIPENDLVLASNISSIVLNFTTSGAVAVAFDPPRDPNGLVIGFVVTIRNVRDPTATPVSRCINASQFAGGLVIGGLAEGYYKPSVVTISSVRGPSADVEGEEFYIAWPTFFTARNILIVLFVLALIMAIAGLIIYKVTKTVLGKKVGEYIRQTITANPEYLSQFDMYKQDEWELAREDIVIGEEIGRGTFGKVFCGSAASKDGIKSQCGQVFHNCAIKTIQEETQPAERLHFLIALAEASVMKQFNSSFIIHLYGVVSDGQPVLVVMEMMEKGNLRDFLRSRRPDSEENTTGAEVPTDSEIMEWAAQIADGMAYLENLKFCHRDLAARNCMIGADNVVKIGDFGMARDIYYHEYYKPTGKRMMPVRWMAPEALKDGKFSLKSDVWAYGIVIYEMMTLAQQPYQGLANDEVFNYIGVQRRVLERPLDCPDFWYDLMKACWMYQPKERPSFRQIVDCVCLRASPDFKAKSWVMNDAPDLDENKDDTTSRTDYIIDEEVASMNFANNRRGTNEMDEYGTGTRASLELIGNEEEDSL